MKWYTIGSLTVPVSQLALGLAFLLIALYLWWKKEKDLLDVYGNTVLLFILVWKFSIALFSFSLVIEAPMSLLYFNGGDRGFWLAVIVAFIYIAWKWPIYERHEAIKLWLIVITLFELLVAILSGQVELFDILRLTGGVLAVSFFMKSPLQVLLLFTLWQLLFESWEEAVFSANGLLYIGVAIGFILIRRREAVG
ncbi:hypothetical protein [Bacillus sp. Hm123]|uniref:hypothetical protein n=1 Tax=Bacillus sp. Hm123 TaxID=3450745 RepID=UPI003F42286C